MKRFPKLFLTLLVSVLVLLQFVPRSNNNSEDKTDFNSIAVVHNVPENVQSILQKSCYDCHSNHTNYPWYSKIQPLSMWISHHIEEGREELNFSVFGSYSVRKKHHKLEEIIEQIEENEMPLTSYTMIHGNAKLSSEEKATLITWTKSLKDSFELVYPKDSLILKTHHG